MPRHRTIATSLVLASLVAVAPAPALAQRAKADPGVADHPWLREKLEEVRRAHHLPALAAAMVVDGEVAAASIVGVRRWGRTNLAQRGDAFHLGSVAKPMTATLVARMVERGKIGWDTRVAAMFPDLADTMQPAYRRVTVAQLLSHSSGMPYQPHTPEEVTDSRGANAVERRYEYVKAALADPPEAEPGTKVIYSGGGILVASFLERSLGRPYEELMRREVFGPLGMTAAGFGAQATPGRIDGPWDHTMEHDTPRPVPPDPAWRSQARAPVGRNVHCSVLDLARFEAMHLEPKGYLTPASLAILTSPVEPVGYGPGWDLSTVDWARGRILWHGGSAGRNHALAVIVPEERFATAILTNIEGDGVHAACDEVNLFLVSKFREGAFRVGASKPPAR